MRHIAYRRVSTAHSGSKQDNSRQLFGLGLKFDLEFEDKQSGSSAVKRTQFQDMLKVVEKGDTIHIQSNDRCFRNTKEMLGFVEDMMCKEVTVKLHSENLEFDAHGDPMRIAMSKLVLTNMAAISEFFLAKLSSDIKQGIANKKAKGHLFGAQNAKWKASNAAIVNKTRQTDAKQRAERYRETFKAIIASTRKPTYRLVATALTTACVELPSGIIGVWNSAQVKRIVDRLEISLY